MNGTKSALWMRGVSGPLVAILAASITSGAALLPEQYGVGVDAEAGTVTINVAEFLGAAAVIVCASAMGIVGRLRAKSTWNGKLVRSEPAQPDPTP